MVQNLKFAARRLVLTMMAGVSILVIFVALAGITMGLADDVEATTDHGAIESPK